MISHIDYILILLSAVESEQCEDYSFSSETETDSNSEDVNLQLQSEQKSAEENGNMYIRLLKQFQ